MTDVMLQWTKADLIKFKQAYKRALAKHGSQVTDEDSFNYEGKRFVYDYAKYLIQYLESQFNVGA